MRERQTLRQRVDAFLLDQLVIASMMVGLLAGVGAAVALTVWLWLAVFGGG